MLKIKLVRIGKKDQPYYKIIISPDREKLNGKYIDKLGYYNPTQQPPLVKIDREKYLSWIKKGAQPTPKIRQLFAKIK